MSVRRLLIVLAFVFGLSACRTESATKIVIRSVWTGLASTKGDRLEILCQREKCSARGQPVPMQDVAALLQVLAAPPMPQAELPNLGITLQWLNENAGGALRGEIGCEFTKEQKALLL